MQKICLSDVDISLPDFFDEVPLLNNIDDDVKSDLIMSCDIMLYERGDLIFHEGDDVGCLYIVYCGRLSVFSTDGSGTDYQIAILNSRQLAGVMAMLSGGKHQVSAKALSFVILLKITRECFLRAHQKDHQLALAFSQILSDRLRDFKSRIYGVDSSLLSFKTIGVLPSGVHAGVDDFLTHFISQLRQYKSVFHISPSILIDECLDVITPQKLAVRDRVKVARYLGDLGDRYDVILMSCDAEYNSWSSFVVNNSDLFLCVGHLNASPVVNDVEKKVYHLFSTAGIHAHYVFLHTDKVGVTAGATKLLEFRKIFSYHHVFLDDPNSFARLVRLLTGNSVSLVLSGGGTRGIAHIGVIRALRELGIEIDAVFGVSMGSIIGSFFALGWSVDEMKDSLRQLYRQQRYCKQAPFISLLNPIKVRSLAISLYGSKYLEDLHMPFVSVAVNMTTGHEEAFDYGLLHEAIIASNSLPPVTSPFVKNKEYFFDGCLINSMPVCLAKRKFGGKTICVQIARDSTLACFLYGDIFPSSWKIITRYLNPFKRRYKIPSLSEVVINSIQLSNYEKVLDNAAQADLCIKPDISDVKPSSADKIDEIVELGYQQAILQLQDWKSKERLPSINGPITTPKQ